MNRPLLALSALALFSVAACGDSQDPEGATNSGGAEAAGGAGAAEAAGGAGTATASGGTGGAGGAEDFGPYSPGEHMWSQRFGSNPEDQRARGMAADSLGNMILVGELEDVVDFGGSTLKSAGARDVYIAKLDWRGEHIWSGRYGDKADYQMVHAVTIDSDDAIIVVGEFEGTLNFGGDDLVSAGGGDIFVAKLDAMGRHVWSKRFGDAADYQIARAVAVDADNNVIVTGDMRGTISFGGGNHYGTGALDVFVAKFDAAGGHLWSRDYGDDGGAWGRTVTVDAANNIIVAGDYTSTIDFGGGEHTSEGGADVFVTKLDAAGNEIWAKSYGGKGTRQQALAIATNDANEIVVAGQFEGTLALGADTIESEGGRDIFIAKLDALGELKWHKRAGDSGQQGVADMEIDPFGNISMLGQFKGSVDFGGGALVSEDLHATYVVKLNGAGEQLWTRQMGGNGHIASRALGCTDDGAVFVSGNFWGDIDFGGGVLSSPKADYDVFVAKFAP